MKHRIERSERIPPFRCDLPAFIKLIDEILSQFGQERAVTTITISKGREKITFESVGELEENADDLPSNLSSLSLYIFVLGGVRECSLNLDGSAPKITVTGESAVWSAGVTEVVRGFAQRHRYWGGYIRRIPFGIVGWLALVSPTIVIKLLPQETISWATLAGYLTAIATLFALSYAKNKFFPAAILVLREKDPSIRKYAPELSLLIAVIALILTVIGWFIQ